MQHQEIITRLAKISDPSEVIHVITMLDILSAITRRMGEQALSLTTEDLQLAREEVKEAIDHNLDIREYIDIGLDVWEITCNL